MEWKERREIHRTDDATPAEGQAKVAATAPQFTLYAATTTDFDGWWLYSAGRKLGTVARMSDGRWLPRLCAGEDAGYGDVNLRSFRRPEHAVLHLRDVAEATLGS